MINNKPFKISDILKNIAVPSDSYYKDIKQQINNENSKDELLEKYISILRERNIFLAENNQFKSYILKDKQNTQGLKKKYLFTFLLCLYGGLIMLALCFNIYHFSAALIHRIWG